jgi:hypothetical protein
VLPSLNGGSVVATGSGDDFDNRDGETISGTGFTDQGTSGEEFTDIGLSTSYDASSSGNNVYNANTGSYGSGGPFPSGSSSTLTSARPERAIFQKDANVLHWSSDPLGGKPRV